MSGQASIFIKDIRSIVQKTVSHTNRLRIHWYSLDTNFVNFVRQPNHKISMSRECSHA